MVIPFQKYQGTGNDFVMIDQRQQQWIDPNDRLAIESICDRRFGIGADGLILLEKSDGQDFKMVYFNADGNQSSMCGNGGRCIVHFAWKLGIFDQNTTFEAIDGLHKAKVNDNDTISLQMSNVDRILTINNDVYVLNTGSPHYIKFVEQWPENIKESGANIRYSQRYVTEGINVNFVKINENNISVATYERGVEDETLSCGTGVTAAAIAYHFSNKSSQNNISIETKGGHLEVNFTAINGKYRDIWLSGPASCVFNGEINI